VEVALKTPEQLGGYPQALNLELLSYFRTAGILKEGAIEVSMTLPDKFLGMRESIDSAQSLLFDFMRSKAKGKGDFIVFDPNRLAVTIEGEILKAAQGSAEVYLLDTVKAQEVVSRLNAEGSSEK
jgi:hypothetical protein